MIDAFTKWSLAERVPTKEPSGTLQTLSGWQSIFGCLPENILTDSGGEYANKEVEEYLELHGVRHLWIPPRAPASNGLVERHNG
eukprot:6691223-Pyramimonas_sp.AAC.1